VHRARPDFLGLRSFLRRRITIAVRLVGARLNGNKRKRANKQATNQEILQVHIFSLCNPQMTQIF
jgi:hypothetical protein